MHVFRSFEKMAEMVSTFFIVEHTQKRPKSYYTFTNSLVVRVSVREL